MPKQERLLKHKDFTLCGVKVIVTCLGKAVPNKHKNEALGSTYRIEKQGEIVGYIRYVDRDLTPLEVQYWVDGEQVVDYGASIRACVQMVTGQGLYVWEQPSEQGGWR